MSGKYDTDIRQAAAEGLTLKELSEKTGGCASYLSARCKSLGVKLPHNHTKHGHPCKKTSSSPRIAAIRELASQGLSQAEIGRRIGISRERVRQLCVREGIETAYRGDRAITRLRIAANYILRTQRNRISASAYSEIEALLNEVDA